MFDLIVAGGAGVDGSGNPGYRADVCVTGETIVPRRRGTGIRSEASAGAAGVASRRTRTGSANTSAG
jgi:hypothetical protein